MRFLLTLLAVTMMAVPAYAGPVTKGDVQRLDLDQITLDSTVVTSTGAELNILDGVTATATEINQAADISERSQTIVAADTLVTGDCGDTIYLASTTGFDVDLPAAAAGCEFWFIQTIARTSGAHTVTTPSLANIIYGGVNELETDTGDDGPAIQAGDTITFVSAPSACVPATTVGDWARVFSDGTNWYLTGQTVCDGGLVPSQAD